METVLVAGDSDPLAESEWSCAAGTPAPVVGRLGAGALMVDETLPERLRRRLCTLAAASRPAAILLAPAAGVDPLGPDPYLQSASFLTAAAALEAGVGVALVTRGVPARGFAPLFRRYPSRVIAQVAVSEPELEPDGAATWGVRVLGLASLAAAGVPTWLRIDPAVPTRSDTSEALERWLAPAAAAGARGVIVAPLVLDAAALEIVGDDPRVVDYYRPGRRPRRGALPVPHGPHLPLERETAFLWRVRRVAEDVGLAVRLCRCARHASGSCGLLPAAPTPLGDGPQLRLWAG
jgi:hypothetical protein